MAAIYEDLFTLFEYYFIDMKPKTDTKSSNLTVVIGNMIKSEAERRWISKYGVHDLNASDSDSGEEHHNAEKVLLEEQKFAIEKIRELKGCMEKIAKTVIRDEKSYTIKVTLLFYST